jgi:hypothetical protein
MAPELIRSGLPNATSFGSAPQPVSSLGYCPIYPVGQEGYSGDREDRTQPAVAREMPQDFRYTAGPNQHLSLRRHQVHRPIEIGITDAWQSLDLSALG